LLLSLGFSTTLSQGVCDCTICRGDATGLAFSSVISAGNSLQLETAQCVGVTPLVSITCAYVVKCVWKKEKKKNRTG
jgi:hypothetical protein